MKRLLLIALLVMSSGPAYAGFTLEKYETIKDTQSFKLYLGGVGEGYGWANTFLEREGYPQLYCQPGKLALNADNYAQILADHITKPDVKATLRPDFPIELLLLHALQSALPCQAVPASAIDFSGSVVSILDGDIIEVLHNTRPERIRLNGIGCPEKGQDYSQRAKQAASELVFGNEVTRHTFGKDKYGRTIADVLLRDGTNVHHMLVKDGWCW